MKISAEPTHHTPMNHLPENFPKNAGLREGLTFRDVLIVPQRSSIASRKHVDPSGRFSRRITLAVPIVSSNMDTVTEAKMAIAMARLGGLGVIHRFLRIAEQAAEVAKVKRAENVVIEEPYTLGPDATIGQALDLMEEQGVGGLLIIDKQGRLVGIVTSRDLQFQDDLSLALSHVMTTKLVTAKKGISVEEAQKLLSEHKLEKLPLIGKDGRLAGLITAKDLRMKRQHPEASKDRNGRLLVGAAVGVVGDYLERCQALLDAGADVLVIDVAHGHADHAISAVKTIRKRWPKVELVAGNTATYEGARDLALAGADGIKVGVGPGSICSTRIVTGCGVPQLTAIMDSAKVTREKDVPIIADGGIRDSGDLTKALAAGASCVMMGSLLAGTDESPGWIIVRNGRRYKIYRGMASLAATISKKEKERAKGQEIAEEEVADVTPEGVESVTPYKGPVADVVGQLAGGLRSGMSYVGARNMKELWGRTQFIRITGAAWEESKPHALEREQ